MKLCECKGRDGDGSRPHTVAWVGGDHNVRMRQSLHNSMEGGR